MGTSPLVGCHEECTHSFITYPQSTDIHKERKSSKKKETAATGTTHFSLNPLVDTSKPAN
jgi:hypothetical protein